jgi:hypothetical protein
MFLKSFDRARESTTAPKKYRPDQSKKNESGQTIYIVAVALVVVLGMAALAVDVTFFYAAHSQAQKAADAAALAGAKAFVSSGFTPGSWATLPLVALKRLSAMVAPAWPIFRRWL